VNKKALRDLSDTALIDAMRDGAPEAWQEFLMRFRPLLEHYGQRTRMDPVDWSNCVDTVLEEAAMRWAVDGACRPKNFAAYLLQAAKFRRLTMERDEKRRARRHQLAVHGASIEGAVLSLCSEAAIRDSYGPAESGHEESHAALSHFCSILLEPLSEGDRSILELLGAGFPHREIANGLGTNYETGRKRIQRLCARVRDAVPSALKRLSETDRAHVERVLLRLRSKGPLGADDDV
jgi:DNA-directed RNA polymerase specialized sigma24 family protein